MSPVPHRGPGKPVQPGPHIELSSSPSATYLPDRAATLKYGSALAQILGRGDLLILRGLLGAGKTTLVQGIGSGLGVTDPITSPTFVIARVHRDGRVPLLHADAYRLGGIEELDDLDLDMDLEDAVTVVEWGEGIAEHLAEAYLLVDLDRESLDAGDGRMISLHPHGGTWDERLAGFGWSA
ncbi:tRNA threonylcarbamoyladenosine biosynthesis protein TsaE [Antricoccus suffuscus]|uniref:tRNA threonylcarbamoyladenosine biosynthesis protein TsaE n=1 Tax=Antricoccus suffuscus TaxID=1629062 RepID=A0A2T0Z364_9ACTN|nr:tRNA (adenosine(37)-N6)-threonylcarbamoyltransferase complex ATPase subunit type 1 TsaE [Antricoccus suffuscus]PRZ30785.1 tRNA threonylcarbamoyladenosine biosynthesis protein TsaE [Antricoccus suffuscus]